MFNKHLLKVIASFCGVIISGLILLVVIDYYKNKEPAPVMQVNTPDRVGPTKPKTSAPKTKKVPATKAQALYE